MEVGRQRWACASRYPGGMFTAGIHPCSISGGPRSGNLEGLSPGQESRRQTPPHPGLPGCRSGPQVWLGRTGQWRGGSGETHHLQLVLLQDLIQVLPLLVVEVEVLTLGHRLGAHHPGDGRPVPAVFQETCAGEGGR